MSVNVKSLYIHYPYCRHRCNFCDFYKLDWREDSTQSFFDRLKAELTALVEFHTSLNVKMDGLDTLYFGGGTPSLMKDGLGALVSYLKSEGLYFNEGYEFTAEVNPEDVDQNLLDSLEQAGVNRISMGIQTLNPEILPHMDRAHSLEQIHLALEVLSKWKKALSLDLMLGLPYSKKFNRNIADEINELLISCPSHLSLYILKPAKDYVLRGMIPDDEYIENEYSVVSNKLTAEGFSHYEVSNFAKPDSKSRHNLAYWKGHNTAALGASGVGFVGLNDGGIRYKWHTNKPEIASEPLSEDQICMERFYLESRLSAGIDLKNFFGDNHLALAIEKANEWEKNGLCKIEALSHIALNSKGFILHDAFVDDFLSLLS